MVPTRKSTRLTVNPPDADAVAVTVVGAPSEIDEPFVGAVRATEVKELATVTLTAPEVVVTPLLSVTFAISTVVPVLVGVQLAE